MDSTSINESESSALVERRFGLFVALLVALTFVVYFLTIRPDHSWNEDFALYLQHARNLIAGLPYAHYGTPFPGHEGIFRYPPGFPVMLIPIVLANGVDLHAVKVFEILVFCAFLLLLAFQFRRSLGAVGVLALLILIAANPEFWKHKDIAGSDLPFLLACFSAMAWWSRRAWIEARSRLLFVLVSVLLVYVSFSIRTAAIVLPAAFLVHELASRRRISVSLVAILAGVGVLVLIQNLLLATDAAYQNPTASLGRAIGHREDAVSVVSAFSEYLVGQVDKWRWVLGRFFDFGTLGNAGSLFFYLLLLPLAGYGYLVHLRREFSVFEVFLPGYVAMFVLTGFGSYERYMFPTVVLLLYYMLYGVRHLPFGGVSLRTAGLVSVTLLATALYGHAYSEGYVQKALQKFTPGVESPDALSLYRFIREETPADAVFLTQNPQALSLYTDRFASRYYRVRITVDRNRRFYHDHPRGWAQYDRVGATHAIVKRSDWVESFYLADTDFLKNFIEPQASQFAEIYRNDSFIVFRIDRDSQSSSARKQPTSG